MTDFPPLSPLPKDAKVTGAQKDQLGEDLRKRYEAGIVIDDLARQLDRSYGFVHRLLREAGTAMRGRGGYRRRKPTT